MRSSWEVGDGLLAWVREFVPAGFKCVEFGSGGGSALLAEHLRVVSVEHDPVWAAKTARLGVPVVLAPIVDGWYASEAVRRLVSFLEPEVVIVDGPPGSIGRDRFDMLVPTLMGSGVRVVIFDDTNRPAEQALSERAAVAAGARAVKFADGGKAFSVVALCEGCLAHGWDAAA